MYIADRNVYGIDLNPVAVELAEVSLWLNTIHEGGFVPWFGTQLVNGNSLIGARRQAYRVENLTTTSKGLRWFELAPERIPVGSKRADKNYQMYRKQIYHFLLGDPGMCSYSDKVIKSLEPDNIKAMKAWNKKFTAPYDENDIGTLLRLSSVIDELWEAQVNLRKEVEQKTQDRLSIFGHQDDAEDSHTTIRQKDKILSELYKSEHMRNAGPYARLKFAMDYWCALWFWPIDKADLLPSRSEFFFDMSLILEGTIASVNVDKNAKVGQLSLFPTEIEQMAVDIVASYGLNYQRSVVDIPALRKNNPRLDLAYRIAEQNKFMHWELEFADLFAEKGGFDLVIGNPPWIKITWSETAVLSDIIPALAIRDLDVSKIADYREIALKTFNCHAIYFSEYESMSGELSFLNATENYAALSGQQTNLYKCFLPQAWNINNDNGVSAFIHPNSIFDDPKGGDLRKEIYPRLRYHFHFWNEYNLFDILHTASFSLNVYSNKESKEAIIISNLYLPKTIDECFEISNGKVQGLKDDSGWIVSGHNDRIIRVGRNELSIFAKVFDESDDWKSARLPALHAKQYYSVLQCFNKQETNIGSLGKEVYSSQMFDETGAQKTGIIKRNVHFPANANDAVISGPHIGVGNPLYKTSRKNCRLLSDYDVIDLTAINESYYLRCNYTVEKSNDEVQKIITPSEWGGDYRYSYRLVSRKMLYSRGERTLMTAIIPPGMSHINGVYGLMFRRTKDLLSAASMFMSLPCDFIIKITGASNFLNNNAFRLPLINDKYYEKAALRVLLLNSMTRDYQQLWNESFIDSYINDSWSKIDQRLDNEIFKRLSPQWEYGFPLRSDYQRRQALIELDVLSAMSLGMTLDQLKTIYRLQFSVLVQNENDTWYDANGRIVFTTNRSLTGVGYDRKEWENCVKGAPAGHKFYRTVTDDTMPEGPIERTIEYVAPFDRCNREQDYETAWEFFDEKYGKG